MSLRRIVSKLTLFAIARHCCVLRPGCTHRQLGCVNSDELRVVRCNRFCRLNRWQHQEFTIAGLLLVFCSLAIGCHLRKPSQAQGNGIAPQLRGAVSNAPVPPITGPGYQDGNIVRALQIGNRRGRDPFRKPTRRRLQNADAIGGNSNYVLTVPILTLPGRGLSIALNLYYNSQLWTNDAVPGYTDLVFDHDADWPAPGWSLGFGKVVQVDLHGGVLVDPDGTPHPYAAGKIATSNGPCAIPGDCFEFTTHTTDGSLIDYTVESYLSTLTSATAKYPNGISVTYGAGAQNSLYATQITDANGNIISIQYQRNKVGGGILPPAESRIQTVTDTLGRVVNFEFDSNNHLTAITAPKVGGGSRTVVRFHYKMLLTFAHPFDSGIPVSAPKGTPTVIDGIFFPATSTGYWFGDDESYSSYGMISKVSQRRGMTLTASSLNDQGTLSPGIMTHDQVYNYPTWYDGPAGCNTMTNRVGALSYVPKHTSMTQCWAGMDVPPAVTKYSVTAYPTYQWLQTVYPDGSSLNQFLNIGGTFDGLMYEQDIHDPSSNVLSATYTTWTMGDYGSPVVRSVKVADPQLWSTTVYRYDFDNCPPQTVCVGPLTNQVVANEQIDYDGKTCLRLTSTAYQNDATYIQQHIFNLPTTVTVKDRSPAGKDPSACDGNIVSKTDYAYDQYDQAPLVNTPGVTQHSNPSTTSRGNVTTITRYKSDTPNWSGIVESHRYDITGNLIEVSGRCCVDTAFIYTVATQFAYPDQATQGAVDHNTMVCPSGSTACLTKSFTYDFGTGVMLTSTDANGLVSSMSYDDASRLLQATLPQPSSPPPSSTAYITYAYDDSAMTITQSVWVRNICPRCVGFLQAQTLTNLNGLGLAAGVQENVGSTWDAVSRQYDARGRLWKLSQPYQIPQQPSLWTTFTYDSLGRTTAIQNPNGSSKAIFYGETNRPGSASSSPGDTVRSVDEAGRERWSRTDALGNLVEVVEPPAGGSGSLAAPGNVDTTYSYNALDMLIRVLQGPNQQERDFQYDLLGRLTAEYLAEKSRTLETKGNYVAENGQWSDVFTYDDHSSLILHVDARGVKTLYDFGSDPLNRLQSVSFVTPSAPGTFDPSSPILPTPSVAKSYMTTGDLTRLSGITLSGPLEPQEQYTYDPQGRLASQTLLFPGQSPLGLTYKYDVLNRLSEEVYPVEYGTSTGAQKTLDYSYGIGGILTDLKIDGSDYASQFAYNPAGQATSITIGPPAGQPTVETYQYDPATNLLQSQTVQRGGSDLLALGYQYYPSGQLHQARESPICAGSCGLGGVLTYDYDAVSRLHDVHATGSYATRSYTWSETYSYDTYGNRLSVATSGNGPDGSPIPLDGLAGTPTPPNGLSALSYDPRTNHVITAGFAYDAAGNQIRTQRLDGSWVRYRYDQANRLAQVTDDSGRVIERYAYRADGRRLRKVDRLVGTTYFWDGSNVIAEYGQVANLPTWTWSKSHAYLGNRILATFSPGSSGELVQYHHPDRLGVRLITDSLDGSATEQATLPFGTFLPSGPPDPMNPIFTSYNRDFATELDYGINRYYESRGRFSQPDPAGVALANLSMPYKLNTYSYSGDDPINSIDPLGLQDWNGIFQSVSALSALVAAMSGNPGLAWGFGAAGGLNKLVVSSELAFGPGLGAVGFTEFLVLDASLDISVLAQLPGTPKSISAVLSNSSGTYASYMNSVAFDNPPTTNDPAEEGTDTAANGSISTGEQVGSGVLNSDGSVTYNFIFPDGSTGSYTVPAQADSSGGGGGCTTQDSAPPDPADKRHRPVHQETQSACDSD
jgi:RHS repeat-associated protein